MLGDLQLGSYILIYLSDEKTGSQQEARESRFRAKTKNPRQNKFVLLSRCPNFAPGTSFTRPNRRGGEPYVRITAQATPLLVAQPFAIRPWVEAPM